MVVVTERRGVDLDGGAWPLPCPNYCAGFCAVVAEMCRLLLFRFLRLVLYARFVHIENVRVISYLRCHWGIVQR